MGMNNNVKKVREKIIYLPHLPLMVPVKRSENSHIIAGPGTVFVHGEYNLFARISCSLTVLYEKGEKSACLLRLRKQMCKQ